MTVSSCPSCHEPVTVPAGAPGSARVRCPLCSDEFLLSVVLGKMPPALVLLDPVQPAGDIEIALTPDASRPPAFEFEEASVASRPGVIRPSSRPRRKEKSAIRTMLEVVIGGVASVPLVLLLLWWVFGRDPVELGPKVARYVPWVVPAKFHGDASDVQVDDKPKQSAGDGSTGENGGVRKVPSKNGESNPKKPDDDPLGSGVGPTAPSPKEPKPSKTQPKESQPKESQPNETMPDKKPSEEAATDAHSGGPKPKRFPFAKPPAKASPLELSSAFQSVQQADAALDQALGTEGQSLSDEDKRKRGRDLYNAYARLGEVILAADPAEEIIQKEGARINGLLATAVKSPRKQKILAMFAENRLNPQPAEKPLKGLCVVGTVRRIGPQGKLYEVDIELATASKTVTTVLAGDDPSPWYQVGSKVLLLGAMVADPAKNLAGYEGEAAEIGCVNYCVVLLDDASPAPAAAAPDAEGAKPADPPAKPADPPKSGDAGDK